MPLPIDAILPELLATLGDRPAAVVQAPPGAGKTTRIPPALLAAPWMAGQRLLLLEPRRLAARAAAHRMAQQLGEPVGRTVGYRMRMDTRVSASTRIEVITEGILPRLLHDDPALEGVGAVLFDEFHERSLQADLGLALALHLQRELRDDLRLLVMSATLAAETVADLLGDAPVLRSEGRMYPVETHYVRYPSDDRLEDQMAAKVREALTDMSAGDVLAFLPGAGEIHRTAERLEGTVPTAVDVRPLYGNLPLKEQDAVLAPAPAGRRKVVLATSIAETSLTIEGVRVVVDSGVMRVPRFDPGSGMTSLATVPVARSSADQRRGRAGRLGPGVCYRLWTKADHARLPAFPTPEIRDADLAPLALELAQWGLDGPGDLAWLDPPPAVAYGEAQMLLAQLGALTEGGAITAHGRDLLQMGLHPRLAHLIVRGRDLDLGPLACDVAALLSERDPLKRRGGPVDADLRLRLDLLGGTRSADRTHLGGATVDRRALSYIRRTADHLRSRAGVAGRWRSAEAAGLLVALAYPDRIGQHLPDQPDTFRLRSGRRAQLTHAQVLSRAPYLAVAHLHGHARVSRIFTAAPVTEEELRTQFSDQLETREVVMWDGEREAVTATLQTQLGALVLESIAIAEPSAARVQGVLLGIVRERGLEVLPWSKATRQLLDRLRFMHYHAEDFPDMSDEALLASLEAWLGPFVHGMRRLADLNRLDLRQVWESRLTWEQRQQLDAWAPTHWTAPTGSRLPIQYDPPEAPVLAVRLQEVFGLTDTPRVGGGRVPLTLHLLSPAHRPIQITQDLAGFWEGSYYDVQKDMKGRYPKHPWPDDPLQATPTRRTKRRSGR